jgi:HPt (histidine-containing phosphotransfer) domain-containing protein
MDKQPNPMTAFSETLAELRRQFADQLSVRMDAINTQAQSLDPAAWQPADAEILCRMVQNLTNSAGVFGMQSVADAAHQVEARLRALHKAGAAPSAAEWQAIRSDLEHLNHLAGFRFTEPAEDPVQAG